MDIIWGCAVLCCVCCAVSALLASCGHPLGLCCAVSAAPSLLCASWGVHVMDACVCLQDSLSVAGCKGAANANFLLVFVGVSRRELACQGEPSRHHFGRIF